MEYQIQLPVFEGPFDLLLHLIKQSQVDIYDIPIAEITEQYIAYLHQMESLDLEIASGFVVMAATLLAIKAKMLLPQTNAGEEEPEQEDARGELVRDLFDYMRFKEAAGAMQELLTAEHFHFDRPNEEELFVNLFSADNPLDGKTLDDLRQAFAEVMKKTSFKDKVLDIEREQITVRDKLRELYAVICNNPKGLAFSRVFADCGSKMELIITFLALLELARQTVLKVSQSKIFGEIHLYPANLERFSDEY
ncbi:MAG: segregation/condensation protein A [Bacillota bacterium]|nr:segregation/condensation protein A [Bacillota bacterium]